jgi:hypothetical protein
LLTSKKLSLRISHDEAKLIARSLEQYKGQLRISLTCAPRANAFPVWVPAKSKAGIVVGPHGTDGSRLGGEFLIIMSGRPENRLKTGLDGFLLELTAASFKKLEAALSRNTDFSLPLSNGDASQFALNWMMTDWNDPISGQTLHARGGWNVYMPNGETTTRMPPANTKKVDLNHGVLLSSDSDIRAAITVEVLADFSKALTKAAISQLERMHPKTQQTIIIQCDLLPEHRAEFKVGAHHVEPDTGPVIKDLYVALNAVKPPASKGKVTFQLVIDVPPRSN